MKILHLTIIKKWFDMIASGEKPEEYREIKKYWTTRLLSRKYDAVKFRNGYAPTSPTVTVELDSIKAGYGRSEWGAILGKKYFVLKLGKILEGGLNEDIL